MSCRIYDDIPRLHDEELQKTNDIREMGSLNNPNKQIRYIMSIKN